MGKYINQINGVNLPNRGKAQFLIDNGAQEIIKPKGFRSDLVCVVENGSFDAAGYVYSEEEFKVFAQFDGRPKQWFIMPGVENHV